MEVKKIQYLDSLRGLACILVVLSHLTLVYFPYLHNFGDGVIPDEFPVQHALYNLPFSFFYSGSAAVYIFFVLSGIVLTKSVRYYNATHICGLVASRYPRLMIPALASCILQFIVLYFIYNESAGGELSSWFYGIYVKPSFFDALRSGVFDAFFKGHSIYNTALWTMQIELYGSIAVYFSCFLGKKIGTNSASALFFSFIVLCGFFSVKLAAGFFCFFIGFSIYMYQIKIKNERVAWFLLVFGVYLGGVHNVSDSYSIISCYFRGNTYSLGNIVSGILIVLAVCSSSIMQSKLSNAFFIRLGQRSFTIYLFHMSFILLLNFLLFDVLLGVLGYDLSSLLIGFLILFLVYFSASYLIIFDRIAISLSKKIRYLL